MAASNIKIDDTRPAVQDDLGGLHTSAVKLLITTFHSDLLSPII